MELQGNRAQDEATALRGIASGELNVPNPFYTSKWWAIVTCLFAGMINRMYGVKIRREGFTLLSILETPILVSNDRVQSNRQAI